MMHMNGQKSYQKRSFGFEPSQKSPYTLMILVLPINLANTTTETFSSGKWVHRDDQMVKGTRSPNSGSDTGENGVPERRVEASDEGDKCVPCHKRLQAAAEPKPEVTGGRACSPESEGGGSVRGEPTERECFPGEHQT